MLQSVGCLKVCDKQDTVMQNDKIYHKNEIRELEWLY
jgi:NADH:ubiquinone oxidoreductase subunit E